MSRLCQNISKSRTRRKKQFASTLNFCSRFFVEWTVHQLFEDFKVFEDDGEKKVHIIAFIDSSNGGKNILNWISH